MVEGFTLQKDCTSNADVFGVLYGRRGDDAASSAGRDASLLPGLIYSARGQLSGMVFAVPRGRLMNPDEVRSLPWRQVSRSCREKFTLAVVAIVSDVAKNLTVHSTQWCHTQQQPSTKGA